MDLINDFFLLVHAQKPLDFDANTKIALEESEMFAKNDLISFADNCSIILATTHRNYQNFKSLKLFHTISDSFYKSEFLNFEVVLRAQHIALHILAHEANKTLLDNIKENLNLLKKEELISFDEFSKIESILNLVQPKLVKEKKTFVETSAKEGKNFYANNVNQLIAISKNLHSLIDNESIQKRLEEVPYKLQNTKFSIGITGIMNAGKSTMLNALLGKEVLGTAVIPETANLSVVKYSENERAVVNFWNTQEWESIEDAAKEEESIQAFVQETKAHFKERLQEFIQPTTKSIEASLDNLASYTSAEHSDKKCNLVKSVDLYTNLDFVKDGVEIVDTPGLDDPVIQREEITKQYLSKCDMMIHLMNVNQSATQKDIEFILDSLLYQNIARLLIVITRVDTVTKEELDEVITYTKQSIQKQLTSINQDAKFNAIVDKIDFIPIAGKLALMHRVGKEDEANALGYNLEQTGILEIEAYLSQVLFGKNSDKAKLVLDANSKELSHIANKHEELLNLQLSNLGKSTQELENEFKNYQAQKEQNLTLLERIESEIKEQESDLTTYIKTLESYASNKLTALQKRVKQRIMDDISYEYKNKRKPDNTRLRVITETGIKDGLIDLIRDYRFQFEKRMLKSVELIEQRYASIKNEQQQINPFGFDAKGFFEQEFSGGFLVNNNSILLNKVELALKQFGKKELEEMDAFLDAEFAKAFINIHKSIDAKLKEMNAQLIHSLIQKLEQPALLLKEELRTKEEIMAEQLATIKSASLSNEEQKELLEKELSVLNNEMKKLDVLKAAL